MLRTISAFGRIGEENAFAVLRPCNPTRRPGSRHHQSRYRPARLSHPRSHRRSRGESTARRPSRLHPGDRHSAAARGGRGRSLQAPEGQRIPRRGDDHAGGQADHVHVDPAVRRTRRRHPLSRPRIPDLSVDDRVTGARPVPVPIREERGFAFSAEETLKLITPETRLLILNSPANPTGGVTPKSEVDKLVAGL